MSKASCPSGCARAQAPPLLTLTRTASLACAAQLAAAARHYCGEVRSSKEPLQLTRLHGIAKEIAAVELGKQSLRPLDEVNALLVQLVQDMGTALSTALESEHVIECTPGTPTRSA